MTICRHTAYEHHAPLSTVYCGAGAHARRPRTADCRARARNEQRRTRHDDKFFLLFVLYSLDLLRCARCFAFRALRVVWRCLPLPAPRGVSALSLAARSASHQRSARLLLLSCYYLLYTTVTPAPTSNTSSTELSPPGRYRERGLTPQYGTLCRMCGLRKELLTQGRVRLSLISPLARIDEDKEAEIHFTNPLHDFLIEYDLTQNTINRPQQTTTSQIDK